MAKGSLQDTANKQARAAALPELRSTRRGVRQQVRALRSMEDPLTAGVEAQLAALKDAGLRRPEYENAAASASSALAQIPAGISSQILSTREAGQEQIGDIQAQEAANRQSILSQLQLAAQEHSQGVQDEIAAEGRQSSNAIAQAQLEKELGLGSYAPDPINPLDQAQAKADLHKTNVETGLLEHPNAEANLTPSERRGLSEDHASAAHYARQLFEEAKAGAFEDAGISNDPKSWDPEIWSGLVSHVSETGKVPIPAAEKAVQAIEDHVHPPKPDLTHALTTIAGAAAPLAIPGGIGRLLSSAASRY